MHLGSVYFVVNDFESSIAFYEKLLQMPVTGRNLDRFAMFEFEGHCISLMNGFFDAENPDKIIHQGDDTGPFADMRTRALAANTHKFVLNFWDEDLRAEHARIQNLQMTDYLSGIQCFSMAGASGSPYYYFDLTDPDGNLIEVNGGYTPADGEFEA